MTQYPRLVTLSTVFALALTGCVSTPHKADETTARPQPDETVRATDEQFHGEGGGTEPEVAPASVAPNRRAAASPAEYAPGPVRSQPGPTAVVRTQPAPSAAALPTPTPRKAAATAANKPQPSRQPAPPPTAPRKAAATAANKTQPNRQPAPPTAPRAAAETKQGVLPEMQSATSGSAIAAAQAALPAVAETTSPGAEPQAPAAVSPSVRPDETQLALLTEVPSQVHEEPDVSALQFDLEHLPMTFAGGWRLDRRPDQVDGRERCLLYSPKSPMFDGYDASAVELEISSANVVVRTDSNIDTSYPNQGLQVDDGELVPFEPALLNERSAYTAKPVQLAMTKGGALKIGLGFWPTWPVTQTQYATIDLSGFEHAFGALQACAQQQTAK